MTRELAGWQDPDTMSPDFAAALILHRAVPGFSVSGLCRQAQGPGPARRATEHVLGCAACGAGQLCETGERLAKKLKGSQNRTRAWLGLRSAAVAEARAQKRREGAA
jgi:hypothetical protein